VGRGLEKVDELQGQRVGFGLLVEVEDGLALGVKLVG
jgi:hypothetical protein